MKIQFHNIEGVDTEYGYSEITVADRNELVEAIEQTFGWTQEGHTLIDEENRYFEYIEEDVQVMGNY